jgi:organic radical activating enzyme
MQKKLIKIHNPNHELYVYWLLTDFCNQKCSYCPSVLHEGDYARGIKPGAPTNQDIDTFCDKLIEISKDTGKELRITISGGEPTLHEKFSDVLQKLMPYGYVEVITNGTRSVNWWKTLPVLPSKVIISLHPEYYDSKKFRISDLTRFLTQEGTGVVFNLICDPTRWDTVMQIVNDIDDEFKPLIQPKVVQNLNELYERPIVPYTEEQRNFIKDYKSVGPKTFKIAPSKVYSDQTSEALRPNKLMADNEHYFFNWRCSAGVNGINVDYKGYVTAGICGMKLLGSMKNFKMLDEYLTCKKLSCTCPGDIVLDKYKSTD